MIIVHGTSFAVDGLSMTENRSDFDVVADILRIAILGSKESEILARCGIDREPLGKYISTVVILKLVSVERKSENFYQLTDKGMEFLRFYHGLRWLLWGGNFDFLLLNILTRLKKGKKPNYIT